MRPQVDGNTDDDPERRRLIAAAWSILERTDFAGLKVQRVAVEARVSTRAFYRHFADKEDLLRVLVIDEMDRAASRLAHAVARAGDPHEQVRAWITAVISAATDPVRVHRARLFTELAPGLRRHDDSLEAAERSLWRPLCDAISRGQRAGLFRESDPESDASMIHSLAGAGLRSAIVEGDATSVANTIDATVDFVLRALKTA